MWLRLPSVQYPLPSHTDRRRYGSLSGVCRTTQVGAGGHGVYVDGAGRAIQQAASHGATVQVVLFGAAAYKGLNVFAVDAADKPIGSWPAASQPADVQVRV
jgi:hypothetical protein